jgi:hypothetical protein
MVAALALLIVGADAPIAAAQPLSAPPAAQAAPADTAAGEPPALAGDQAGEPAGDPTGEPVAAAVPDFFATGVSGTAAVLMTPVFPGWGQLYAENSWRAVLAFGSQWYFWSSMLARDRQAARYRNYAKTIAPSATRDLYDLLADEYAEQMRDFAWWSGAVLLIVALDAYVGAGLYGFDTEPLPVPHRFEEFFDAALPEPVGSRGAPMFVLWQWSRRF